MNENKEHLAIRFAALGDQTRLAIVERLVQDGPLHAGALGEVSEISAPALSRHLKVLREAGIVTRHVDKQRRIYAIDAEAIKSIADWTMEAEAFWFHKLDRLAAHFASKIGD